MEARNLDPAIQGITPLTCQNNKEKTERERERFILIQLENNFQNGTLAYYIA
jgi:hypothetical protein